MSASTASTRAFHLTAKVAVAPRGTVSLTRVAEAFRVDALLRPRF